MKSAAPHMVLRRATLADIEAMLGVKSQLSLAPRQPAATSNASALPATNTSLAGGFLLGSSADQSAFFIEHANVIVLEDAAQKSLIGFAVTLRDAVLRSTDVWTRRSMIEWSGEAGEQIVWQEIEDKLIGYFEQLAILPARRYKVYAPALAFAALLELLHSNHEHVFTTVVREPVRNLASLPMLKAVGAKHVGYINEEYEFVARILSDVYHLDCSQPTTRERLFSSALSRKITRMMKRLAIAECGLRNAD